MINVTSKDARAATIVPPAWYVVDVKKVETKAAKTDQSTNFVFSMEIVSDLKGSDEFSDIKLKDFLINEKGLFTTGLAFLVACGFPKDKLEALKKDKNAEPIAVDENMCVGQRIKAFVKTSEYEGRKSNEPTDFLPLDSK
jgi:hypothetical protein